MSWETLLLFSITVIPLICTPGPDIIYTVSQGLSKGRASALRAVAGVLLGYSAHAVLSAFGVAALVSASPLLFSILKWVGVAYLCFLALQMLYSSCHRKSGIQLQTTEKASIWKGFFTSFLNPKGLLMYLAVLPQFISPEGNVAQQAILLSLLFIVGCAFVYTGVGLLAARAHGNNIPDKLRRRLEAIAGILLVGAAAKIATQHQ